MTNQRFELFLLKHLHGIGNKGLLKLLNHIILNGETIKNYAATDLMRIAGVSTRYQPLFEQSVKMIWNHQDELLEAFYRTEFLTIMDEDYPMLLLETYNPPVGLFYKGDKKLLRNATLAVVGTREATSYGKKLTNKIVADLIKQQYTIVSGLAKGIDTFAHQEAIAAQGQTIAVVAHGLDKIYPKENAELFEKLSTSHLVLSEYKEGTLPKKHQFPMRNRIIAGLSHGVCVIEAKQRSGSLITAQQALDNNREVFAVPGPIDASNSEGCHELIQNGAKLVTSANHIIEEIKQFRLDNVDKRLTK
ncbi:DNA-processing protein DprA [Vagococcus xieshaowenii]|uniref:DNA-protecting protein DprA n=1 Tax=Vagococcus xieshaowenii TaxID=2562451 RepID=A0AAJ5EFB3_9ENTE|nr:DNA-processing protein DprA [Vagococcus xieshaowenii]QCA28481.1 DNA-protecting protein DprA [Vagococcus xieshaowenii]TFZ42764.1 DNA-protecting protein DprA [Vagococcus xieshaowenii]